MENDKTYRVVRLLVENFKKLKAVDVTPGRNVVEVRGRNMQGKSSLLDSIAAALGGKKQMCDEPLRRGAEDGQIVCVIGEPDNPEGQLLVKRTLSANGKTALEITAKGGFAAPSPQTILDSLCNQIAFDPLAFVQMDDKDQLETLRKLVGLDFTELDAERKRLYDERTVLNREADAKRKQAEGISLPPNTPETEVSLADLMAEQKRRQEHNRKNQVERDRIKTMDLVIDQTQSVVRSHIDAVEELKRRIAFHESKQEDARMKLAGEVATQDAQRATIEVLRDQDVDAVQQQIVDAQDINANVNALRRRKALEQEAKDAADKATVRSENIASVDERKAKAMAAAKWPVPGLSFGEHGVLYNSLPLSQASSAEATNVSFAMAAALHPQVKVALIRNASLLDDEQRKALYALAEKYDTQAWLETVASDGGPCGILIEDGECVSGGTPEGSAEIAPKRRKWKTAKPAAAPVVDTGDAPF